MKIVVYNQRVDIIESYGERRDCADQRIPKFIKSCGFLPITIPNNSEIAEEIINEIKPSGVILVGGNSLVKYGGNAPERDATDKFLIDWAINRSIPLYGFCRGMQSILNYFGNELVNVTGHIAVKHAVYENDDEVITVNSYHSQGCLELTDSSLEVVARANDGVIEKVKHRSLPIIGTMWHPERENPFLDKDIKMLKELLGKC